MKKLLLSLFVILLSFGFAQSEWQFVDMSWGGNVASDTLITTRADTTEWFALTTGGRFGKQSYPETLSFLLWADQTSTTDSTNGVFTLQLSNDKTYIHDYGTLVTLAVGDIDLKVDDKIITDLALFKYGRIIITAAMAAGDSVMFGAQLTKDFSNY